MDKSAILAGATCLIMSFLLLFGEYLCVEIAWVCSKYQPVTVSLGLTLLIAGIIFMSVAKESKDARNDL